MANDVILYRKLDGGVVTVSEKLANDPKYIEKHGLFKMPDDFAQLESYNESEETTQENKEIEPPKRRGRKPNK